MINYYERAFEFAETHLLSTSSKNDELGQFPIDAFNLLAEEDFLSLIIPTQFGGKGKWLKEHAEVVKAFSEINPSFALAYMMHNVALSYVVRYGHETMKKEIFLDVINDGQFCALAGTEGGSGVHMAISEFVVEDYENYSILNGSKHMVTGGNFAKWYMLVAPKAQGSNEVIQWFVSKDSEGVSFDVSEYDSVGMRANHAVPMIFNDVKINHDYRIDPSGQEKDYPMLISFVFFLMGLASVSSGICSSLYHLASKHVKERVYPNGNKLADLDTVKIHIANLYSLHHSAHSTLFSAIDDLENNKEGTLAKMFSSRIIASENAIESANIAMRVGGGKTYNKVNAIERFMRDSYAGQIMTPSVDVLKINLGTTCLN